MFMFRSLCCTHARCLLDVFRPCLALQRNSCTFEREVVELSGSRREPRVMAVSSPGRMITIQLTEMRFGVYKGWWGTGCSPCCAALSPPQPVRLLPPGFTSGPRSPTRPRVSMLLLLQILIQVVRQTLSLSTPCRHTC